MVASGGLVFGEEALDCRAVQVCGDEGLLVEEQIMERGAEGGAEPIADGDGEAFFGAGEDLRGEVCGEGLAEDAFGDAGVEELVVGEGVGEFDEGVIEEGGADFEGLGHGGGVDFAEEVAGEVFELVAEEGGAE